MGEEGEKKKFWGGPCAGRKKLLPLQPCSVGRGGVRRREAGPGGGRRAIRKEFFDAMVPIKEKQQ